MKRIGSLTEDVILAELCGSRVTSEQDNPLARALCKHLPGFRVGYGLFWVREQTSEIFVLLVSSESIATVELSTVDDAPPLFELKSVRQYARGLRGRSNSLKLEMALEEIRKDLAQAP
jgi:hypothetical protein